MTFTRKNEYCHISREEFETALGVGKGELVSGLAFLHRNLRGVKELVYEAIQNDRLSVRVFSSIVPGTGSRDVGEDAIRCQRIYYNDDGKEQIIGTEKRVNRIQTWRKNLLSRIETMSKEEVIVCPLCSGPMKERRGEFGKFIGCINFPACKGTRKVER